MDENTQWSNNWFFTDNCIYLSVCSYILWCIQRIQVILILFFNLCLRISKYILLYIQVILILFMNLCFSCILCFDFFVSYYVHYVFGGSLVYLCGCKYKHVSIKTLRVGHGSMFTHAPRSLTWRDVSIQKRSSRISQLSIAQSGTIWRNTDL